ncbi:MAG: hypothetical protein Fur0046_35630 [Cyanobacteria bacterium J069]
MQEVLRHDLPWRDSLYLLRRLPVDFDLAPKLAIAHIQQVQPDIVVCCGMAEARDRLNLEAQAMQGDRVLKTPLDLTHLAADLAMTDISYDAGQFVCNALYFSLLKHTQDTSSASLFIHIPVLTPENRLPLLHDFCQILHRLGRSDQKLARLTPNP